MTDEAATPAPPRHTRVADRLKTVPLDWPIEFDGKVYDSIVVRRLTVSEIAEFQAKIAAASSDGQTFSKIRWPMYDAPDAVLDALDDDDSEMVLRATNDFLPRRFRDETASEPTQPDGDGSQPA